MTLTQAGSKAPFADVPVTVFYLPFNPPAHFSPAVMAATKTTARGTFKVTLDTAMVPRSGLADVGAGPRAFNTVILAVAQSQQVVIWHQVLNLGTIASAAASALTDPATGDPELAAAVPRPQDGPPNNARQIGSHFRYVPVLAMNNAPGMHAEFTYTFDQSTSKQTMADAADSFATEGGSFGPFSAGGGTTELSDRSVTRNAQTKHAFHNIIWADYKFLEYFWVICRGKDQTCTEFHEWDIDQWQGSLVVSNPNKQCTKFSGKHRHRHCVRQKKIGVVRYKVPPFTYCNGQCVTKLTTTFPDFIRNQVNSHTYSWQLDVAGFLTLGAESAYGKITSVTWTRRPGCRGRGRSWVLWGHHATPVAAPVLQAACMKLP